MSETTVIVPKMMTIRETARTGILPEHALREMEKQGQLPGIHCGVKFMVNFDKLVKMLGEC